MAIIQLTGKKDKYLFDPENEATVLKRKGKFGSVYAGARVSDQKHVVIKFLNPELKKFPDAVKQFSLESDLQIDHPQLRKTYEFLEEANEFFLIQEYITGSNLKVFLHQHSQYQNSVKFILNCVVRILDALDYLHSGNIIHCDIKPANILVEHYPQKKIDENNHPVKLIDLGQSKTPESNFVSATKPFSIIYSPPEQVLHFHELVNPSSDLFALGNTIYELITNENPYGSMHPEMLMHKQISGDIEESEKIPDPLFKIIKKAVAKNKFPLPPNQLDKAEQKVIVADGMKKRFQSACEMKKAIEEFMLSYTDKKYWLKNIFG